LLHDHQTGLLAKEDLIAGALADPVPTGTVEYFQQRRRAQGGRMGQAAQSGDTGQAERALGLVGQGLGQQRNEEAAGDGQTDALGLGDAGELREGVGIDEDALLQLAAQPGVVGAELVNLVVQILQAPLGSGAIDSVENFKGVTVEGLPRESGALRLLGDGSVGSVTDSGGVGDAESGR
jgi:hypothetical protein